MRLPRADPIVLALFLGSPAVDPVKVASSLNLLVSAPLERCNAHVTTLDSAVESIEVKGALLDGVAPVAMLLAMVMLPDRSSLVNPAVMLSVARRDSLGHLVELLGPIGVGALVAHRWFLLTVTDEIGAKQMAQLSKIVLFLDRFVGTCELLNRALLHLRPTEATFCRVSVVMAVPVKAPRLVCLPARPVLELFVDSSTLLPFPRANAPALLLDRARNIRALKADVTPRADEVVSVASAPSADVGLCGAPDLRLVVMAFRVLLTTIDALPFMFRVDSNLPISVEVVAELTVPPVPRVLVTALFDPVAVGPVKIGVAIGPNANNLGVMLATLVV